MDSTVSPLAVSMKAPHTLPDGRHTASNGTLVYHQTIIPTQTITHTIEGSFSLPNAQDLVVIRQSVLELWTLHAENGNMECLHSTPLFANVYAAVAVPANATYGSAAGSTPSHSNASLRGENKRGILGEQPNSILEDGRSLMTDSASGVRRDLIHYLALTSETGYLALLRYELAEPPIPTRLSAPSTGTKNASSDDMNLYITASLRGKFIKVSEHCLGRSGARLTVPGARMAVDSRGEALFIAALMRNKVIIPLKRTNAKLSATAQQLRGSISNESYDNMKKDDNDNMDELDSLSDGDTAKRTPASEEKKQATKERAKAPKGVIAFGNPIEAHRNTVILSVCALEGFMDENAVFSALEHEIIEDVEGQQETQEQDGEGRKLNAFLAPGSAFLKLPTANAARDGGEMHTTCRKFLVVYAYVPSLRQVQRTHLVRLPSTAHRLVSVPAAPCGPGGVLVCTDVDLIWYDLLSSSSATSGVNSAAETLNPGIGGVFKSIYPFPRRVAFSETLYNPSIIQHAVAIVANDYFLLLQDEQGDLFRVLLSVTEVQRAYDALRVSTAAATSDASSLKSGSKISKSSAVPNPLAVHYFDTIPPACTMVLFRRGYLFATAESATAHGLYKITRDGYSKDSEYVVKRMRRVLPQLPVASEGEAGAVSAKRQRDEDGQSYPERGGGLGKNGNLTNMPAPAPLVSKAVGGGAGSCGVQPQPPSGGRVIAMYQPHRQLRHMGLVQSYPNTPSIVSFAAIINDRRQHKAADQEDETERDIEGGRQNQDQQRQVQIIGVAGRGSDSVLFSASYGYATRREGRFVLPASFQGIVALPAATALQQLAQTQRTSIAQVSALLQKHGSNGPSRQSRKPTSLRPNSEGGGHEQRRRVKAVKQLLALIQQQQQVVGRSGGAAVAMDKVVLTTAQGTTVFQVGRSVELDNWTGFITVERTLAAATLPWGQGYVQVTPRGIYVMSAGCVNSHDNSIGDRLKDSINELPLVAGSVVGPSGWTDPHGKLLLAAAAVRSTVFVSFMKGGIASFKVETDSAAFALQLKQCDALPTFPTSQAISLLFVPSNTGSSVSRNVLNLLFNATASSTVAAAASASLSDGALQSMLEQAANALDGNSESGGKELAAVATIAQEVYILDPTRLREPLEKITCRRKKSGSEHSNGYAGEGGIVSILLTFLGGGTWQTSLARRLFCLIGHLDGALTRCELDPATGKLIERVELSCGSAPCQLIAGDSETVCYIQSAQDCWRCDMRDGVVRMVPWRFPSQQTAFAAFVLPPKQQQPNKEGTKRETHQEGADSIRDEEGNRFLLIDGNGGGGSSSRGGEYVIAVRNREMSLFHGQENGSGGSGTLEYSMSAHPLSLEGRRILQHPTRPSYFIVASTEHRSHGMKSVERSRREAAAAGASPTAEIGIPLDAPGRALGPKDHYNSSLQLFVKDSNHVFPPYYLPEGDAIMSVAAGSFQADFGKEPVVVVGAASQYSHGAGCGKPPSWTQGWLRAFRFTSHATTIAVLGSASGNSGVSQQRAVMMDSEGRPILRLEPLHNTLIRTNPAASSGLEGGLNWHENSGAFGAPDYPSAVHICEDVGLLFVGLGPEYGLRIYVWGQQQFLRKRQLPNVPSRIVAIETMFYSPPGGCVVNAGSSTSKNTSRNYFLADLYHCPFDRPDARRKAQEQQLLVVCATISHSVFIATLQPGGPVDASSGGMCAPSFLIIVAQDVIPRSLTALAVLKDERTVAVADRFGYIIFLRLPSDIRTRFALSIEDTLDPELSAAHQYISNEQDLEEVACHYTGELVTALQTQPYNPSEDADPSLAVRILFYGTTMGRIGAYIPFVSEEDAAMAAYAQPVLISHLRTLLAPEKGVLPYNHRSNAPWAVAMMANPTHNIVDGDLMALYRRSSSLTSATSVFTAGAKTAIKEEIETICRMEAARRKVLGLPPRELPPVADLIAKQRALVTLPQ